MLSHANRHYFFSFFIKIFFMISRFTYKTLLGLSLAICLSQAAAAQSHLPAAAQARHRQLQYQPYGNGSLAQKGAGTGSREVAYTYANGTNSQGFITHDSSRYFYPSVTSNLSNQMLIYVQSGGPNMQLSGKVDNSYTNGKLTLAVGQDWVAGTSSYINGSKSIYINDAAGNNTDLVMQVWDVTTSSYHNYLHYAYTYNSANQLMTYLEQTWNTATASWRNSYQFMVTYNAHGSLLNDLDQTWDTVANSWSNALRFNYTYDASGLHALTYQYDSWVSGAWQNTYRESYTNDAAGRPVTAIGQQWNTGSNAWDNSGRTTNAYNAAGQQTASVYEQSVTSTTYANYAEVLTTYNTYDQITSTTELYWTSGAWAVGQYSYQQKYYYEPYTTTGIGSPAAAGLHLDLGPNPASDVLRIEGAWDAAQAHTGQLTDMQGRVCRQFSGPVAKAFSATVSVNDLPAGVYLLSIQGSAGGSATRMITKRN